ncbi:MAG: [Fe-Fe] hydrogenase large subunit C-terminal domain-containing protein, partial [Treponemataceae bacterium]
GENTMGKITTALRMLGFDKVYDTAFGADLTVVEEANEFIERTKKGEKLPLFTSCCPAWVKFAEQLFPELLPKLSTCMSPQSMMGSIIREDEARTNAPALAENGAGKNVIIVSVMPCTAKKYEITRPELSRDGKRLVDYVLTTAELAAMMQESGIRFADLPTSSMDLPLGFATGAGIVFGNAGGVSEAVARYVTAGLPGGKASVLDFVDEIPDGGIRIAKLTVGDKALSITSVQGLANAKKVAKEIIEGKRKTDIVEVMACPGGCVGGAGQPISLSSKTRKDRTAGILEADGTRELRSTAENPFIERFYKDVLGGEVGGAKAHCLLHTRYKSKKRIQDTSIPLVRGTGKEKISVKVCVGTSCFLRGSQAVLSDLLKTVEEQGLSSFVDISATFCAESCDKGPTVRIDGQTIHKAVCDDVMQVILPKLKTLMVPVNG